MKIFLYKQKWPFCQGDGYLRDNLGRGNPRLNILCKIIFKFDKIFEVFLWVAKAIELNMELELKSLNKFER